MKKIVRCFGAFGRIRSGMGVSFLQRQRKFFMTIKREMFLLSVLSFFFISLVISGVFLKILYDNDAKSARDSLRECNSQIRTFTEGLFRENAAVVEILAQNDVIIHAGYGDEEALLAPFDRLLEQNVNLTYAYAGYADGSLHIRGYDTPADYDVLSRPWYKAAMAADGVARHVYRDAATDVWLFSQCMKLVDEEGKVVGALAVDCSNESITRQLSTKYRYKSQRSFIIDPDGLVLIHPAEIQINRSLRRYMPQKEWDDVTGGRTNYAEYMLDGVKAMAYFERIPGTQFTVVTAIDASEVMSPIIRSLVMLLGIVTVVSLAMGLALSRLYISRFARPIQELSGRIRNVAAGNPDTGHSLGTSNAEIQSIAENIEIIVKDMANREEKRKAAEYLSFHDSMTGLYNRRFYEEELNRLDTKRNYPLCLLCCDVNGLKLVNDVFGHALGDRLLVTVANSLQQAMRTDDILARVGGDEFSIILPRTGDEEAQLIMRRLKSALPLENLCGAEISVSLGYAVKQDANQSLEEVLRSADEKMYAKKTTESLQMKQRTVQNIILSAEQEGLVRAPSAAESRLLRLFSDALCPESSELLTESYRLRKLGLCTLLLSLEYRPTQLSKHHTETCYRILSTLDQYRGAAACVLHYNEHWDGSGWPSGLSGLDIPLLSRIIAVVEADTEQGRAHLQHQSGIWYDQDLVQMLLAAEV